MWGRARSLLNSAVFPTPVEYGLVALQQNMGQPSNSISNATLDGLLHGPAGLYDNPPAFAQFASLCQANMSQEVMAIWGLTLPQCKYATAARVPTTAAVARRR